MGSVSACLINFSHHLRHEIIATHVGMRHGGSFNSSTFSGEPILELPNVDPMEFALKSRSNIAFQFITRASLTYFHGETILPFGRSLILSTIFFRESVVVV